MVESTMTCTPTAESPDFKKKDFENSLSYEQLDHTVG
jgi:hypothetical protein